MIHDLNNAFVSLALCNYHVSPRFRSVLLICCPCAYLIRAEFCRFSFRLLVSLDRTIRWAFLNVTECLHGINFFLSPKVDHDFSLLVPEVWGRMRREEQVPDQLLDSCWFLSVVSLGVSENIEREK